MSTQKAVGVKVTCPSCRKHVNATVEIGVPIASPMGSLLVPTTTVCAHNCGEPPEHVNPAGVGAEEPGVEKRRGKART